MAFFLGITEITIASWIIFEVSRSMSDPSLLHNPSKYRMYRNMVILLSISVSISFIVAIIEVVFEALNNIDNFWRFIWMFGTYWEVVYFIVIAYIALVWKPSENNARYIYVEIPLEGEEVQRVDGIVELETESYEKNRREFKKSPSSSSLSASD